jgi:hypothetical protein
MPITEMYHSNSNIEEFSNYLAFMDREYTDSIRDADKVYIDVEKYIFGENSPSSFTDHRLSLRDLTERFNLLLNVFNEIDEHRIAQNKKQQYRFLSFNLIDVKSTTDEDLFWWSFYSHKFAASQAKDTEAMDKWHALEDKIDPARIAAFKALRETNMAFYLYVIKNHMFFSCVLFSDISSWIQSSYEFGFDRAEEKYLRKSIQEYHAQEICKIVAHGQSLPLLNLIKVLIEENLTDKALKGHIISNSKTLNPEILLAIKQQLAYLSISEADLKDTDFVILVNDLDLLSMIPEIDTDKGIFAVDLSRESSPNFPYLLLKDEGFKQIYSFAKKHLQETFGDAITRALGPGILSLIKNKKFTEQLTINYMDDYFISLAQSLGKSPRDFVSAIDILAEKLEENNAEK